MVFASRLGNVRLIEALVDAGVNVDPEEDTEDEEDGSVMHIAVFYGVNISVR